MAKKSQLDVSNLSREEKMRLLDALEEKQRRLIDRRDAYHPNIGQMPVHQSDKKVRAVFSANGAGKTTMAVNEVIWAATGYNPITEKHTMVPARVIVVLDRPDKVADVWMPEIKKWYNLKENQLHKRGKPYVAMITFDNGSEVHFMTHDMSELAYESTLCDFVVADEPPPRHIYIALRRGGRRKGAEARYLLIGTPITGAWLRKEIYEPWARGELKDTDCFRFGTIVNKDNLSDGYIESFSSVLSEKEKRIRLEGEFFDLEGLALAHLFDREKHVIAPPQKFRGDVVISVDPHPRKAHVALMLGVDDKENLVVLKELASRKPPAEFARELRNWYRDFNVVDLVCDSFGSSELTGGDGNLSFIQVLRDNGVRIRATTYAEKDDESWIQMIQQVLALPLEPDNMGKIEPRLKVSSDCKGLISDIEHVQWVKYKNLDELRPKLDITDKDFLACLKYALATQPRFNRRRDKILKPAGPVGWSKNERWRRPGR